jgi:site-specific DNA recombinase
MDKKVAGIYVRKSRENAVTLEGQLNACLDWCNTNDVEYEVFAEEGSSSSEDWDRPKLQELIKAVENLEFNLVICTEQTRICRDDNFPIFKGILRETETFFVTVDTNGIFDYSNPDDELKSDILQAVGKNELSRTKIRLKRGTVQSAKKGNWQGKKAPLGYSYDHETKRLKLNEYAPAIRKMFEMYLEGLSTVEISYRFRQENVICKYKKKGQMVACTWEKSTIARALQSVVYAGHTLFGKTKMRKIKGKKAQVRTDEEYHIFVRETHDAIVSDEEWDRVQEMMTKKRTQPPALKHAKHVFSGLIVCASCGKVRTFERQMDKNREWRIGSCTTRNYNEDFTSYKMCGNSSCKLSIVEQLFYKTLEKVDNKLEQHLHLLKEHEISDDEFLKKQNEKEKATNLQIDNLKKKRKRILQLIEQGDVYEADEEVEKMQEIKEIQIQIKQLEKELQEVNEVNEASETLHVEKILGNIRKFLKGKGAGMTEREQNEILHEFVNKIVYSKEGRHGEVHIEVHLKEEIEEIIGGGE